MNVKPFYRQMKQYGTLSACGMYPSSRVEHDDSNLPSFMPGYSIRVTGDVRELSAEEVSARAAGDRNFNVAVYDIKKYPATRIFLLYKGWGEYYDFDYARKKRDHKLERQRFAWGGAAFPCSGLFITDACIGCGACAKACTFDAIEVGTLYRINGARCDECGNCRETCPVNAIEHKGI